MAKKRKRQLESDDSPPSSGNTVFIATNLDTHLALAVSDADTVSDLKKKIMYEHPQCFPNFGELKIRALKVKRRGNYYHLSDSMHVRSAFEGATKSWYLLVDAVSLKQLDENRAEVSNQLPLLCFTKTSSETPSQKSSHLGELVVHKVTSTDHSGPGCSFKEVSGNVVIGDTDVSGDLCEVKPSNSKGGSDVDLNRDQLKERSKSPVIGTEPKYSEESLREPLAKEKRRSKKKTKDLVSNCIVKDNETPIIVSDMDASHPQVNGVQSCPVNSPPEMLNRMEDITLFETSDTSRRLDSRDVPGELEELTADKSRNLLGDEQLNNHPVVEASKFDQPTKKKRERSTKVQENETLLPSFSKDITEQQTSIPDNSMGKTLEITTTISDRSLADPPEDLVDNVRSGKKNKKRQKLSREQVGSAKPSSLHNAGELSMGEVVETAAEKSTSAAAAIVSEQNTQRPTEDSQKQKHNESSPKAVGQHTLPSSSTGIDISEPDSTVAKGKIDAPEVCHRNGSKGRKKSKKGHSARVQEAPPPVLNELDEGKTDFTPAVEEIIAPDHQKVDENNPENVEQRRNIVNNGDPGLDQPENQGKLDTHSEAATSAKLVETNGVIESGKSSGKRIKRRAKKSTTTKPVVSGVDDIDNFDGVVSPTAPHPTSNDHHHTSKVQEESIFSQTEVTRVSKPEAMLASFIGDYAKGDDMSGKDAESPPVQEAVGNMDGKQKGRKRNQNSDAKTLTSFTAEEQAKEPILLNEINMTRDDAENTNGKSRKKSRKSQKPGVKCDMFVGDNEKGGDMSVKKGAPLPVVPANKAPETMETTDGNSRKRTKKNVSSDMRTSTSLLAEEQINELESDQLNQIKTTQKDAQSIKGKSRKKTRKDQESGAKSLLDVAIQEQKIGNEELASSVSRLGEMNKTERKTKSAKRSSKDELINQEAELHDSGVEPVPFQSTENEAADLTHVPSSEREVPKSANDGVNFKEYFVPGERKHEVGPADLSDKLTEVRQSDEEKSKKKGKVPGIPSLVAPPDLQNSAELVSTQGRKTKSHSKPSHTLENEVNPLDSHGIKQLKGIPEKAKQPDTFNVPKIVSSVPMSPEATSSTSERSDKIFSKKGETKPQPSLNQHRERVTKASRKETGGVVNSSQHQKSLLATPAAIFKDSSSESSEGHDGPVDSDATTRTPSDNSSSSDYSEVESKSGGHGSYGALQDGGGDSIRKSQSAGPKHTMDMIFRSSSRFKKAKLTATQSQLEDTESQPVEFVPETQPIV